VEQAVRQPDATVYERSNLSSAHKNLADVLGHPLDFNFGDRAGAISHYRTAVAIDEALSAADPQDVRARNDLANDYFDFGSLLLEDQPAEALRLHQQAAGIAKELTEAVSGTTKYSQTLAFNQMGSGLALLKLGRNQEAIGQLSPALETLQSVSGVVEDQVRLPIRISQIHRGLGAALLATGDERRALEHLQQGLAVTEELVRRAPSSLYAHRARADAFESLGSHFGALARRRPEHKTEARAWFQKSLDLWQDWVSRNVAAPYAGARQRQAAALIASIDKPQPPR
jgi:tetratricopeptide (TPR) repeat protein